MPLSALGSADVSAPRVERCDTRRMVEPIGPLRRRNRVTARLIASVVLVSAALAGCSSHASQPGPAPAVALGSGSAPAVVGLPGNQAVGRLRAAGYETIAVKGRWSGQRVGVILAQHSSAPGDPDAVVHLVASKGGRRTGRIYFPGVATCELSPMPSGAACAGGPVLLSRP
jgi:hypothetical protein